MKTVAFVPIKLHNQRLPGKNLLPLRGVPLCVHVFSTLLKVPEVDEVFAYCSDDSLKDVLPPGVTFLKRDKDLDGDCVKGGQIYRSFIQNVDADVYVLAHATSPFTQPETVEKALGAVLTGDYDSAFSAERIQTFAWYRGKPINYDLDDVPRTQDIDPVWIETSGFYIFKKDVFVEKGQRIGSKPFIAEVSGLETVDIDESKDYEMACRMIGEYNE